VPDGMASHWFHDHGAIPPTALIEPGTYRSITCGRRFQAPPNIGVGVYDGVEITDHGSAGIPAAVRADAGVPRPAIGGASTWFRAATAEGVVPHEAARWTAFVDERFVVAASSEALLREALQRRGPPRIELLERVTAIDPAACDVVVRNLSPADVPAAVGSKLVMNVPGVVAVVEVVPSPYRVRMFGVDEAELRALARYAFPFEWTWRTNDDVRGMRAIKLAATPAPEHGAPPQPAPDPAELLQVTGISLCICFGLWIFI